MKKSILLTSLLALFLVGCSSEKAPNSDISQTEESNKTIITSFYPLYFIASEIAGDRATVINLADGVDVHDFTPTPQDMVQLNQADLVVFQGADLEPWADGVMVDLEAKGVAMLEVTHDLELLSMKDKHEEHEDEDEHKGEENEEEHDEHHHGEYDPHTWLDPVLAQDMIEAIKEAMSAVDPANEATYEANAEALEDRFAALHAEYKAELAQCDVREVIAAHDAYWYLSTRYNFTIHAIAGLAPKDEPSAKTLAALKAEAAEGITHILFEENPSKVFAETLAAETGLETLPVNPLERGTFDADKDFVDVMEDNLANLKIALGCE